MLRNCSSGGSLQSTARYAVWAVTTVSCPLVAICLAGCVFVPVPIEPPTSVNLPFAESDLDFVQAGLVSRELIVASLGPPTIWLQKQNTLVYGLRRVADAGWVWFIGAGGAGAGGLVAGEENEGIFFVMGGDDDLIHWGRVPVGVGETWLSAANRWAGSEGFKLPPPRSDFVEDLPGPDHSIVYFYRPRDFQYYLPLVPPAEKLPFGIATYADVRLADELVGQIRWQSYVAIRTAPGVRTFEVDPDTDQVVNPTEYRRAAIQLNLAPGGTAFVEVGIEAGRGQVETRLVERSRSEALPFIRGLGESW